MMKRKKTDCCFECADICKTLEVISQRESSQGSG